MSFYTELIQFLLALFRLLSNIVVPPHICAAISIMHITAMPYIYIAIDLFKDFVMIFSLPIIAMSLATLSFRNIVDFVCMVIIFTVPCIIINKLGIKNLIISILIIRLISALKETIVTPSRFIKKVQNELNIGKYLLFDLNWWFYFVDDTISIDRQEFCDKFIELCESNRIQIPTKEILSKLDNMCICAFIILISTFSCSPDLVFNAFGIDNNILKQFEIKTFMEYNTLLYVLKKYFVLSRLNHINGKLRTDEYTCMVVYSDKREICIVEKSPNNRVQTTVKLLVNTTTFNIVDIKEIENDLFNRGYNNKVILGYIAYFIAYYRDTRDAASHKLVKSFLVGFLEEEERLCLSYSGKKRFINFN